MKESQKYIVIDLMNFKILFATNKNMISNNTGIHRNLLIDLPDRKTIRQYLIIKIKRDQWL